MELTAVQLDRWAEYWRLRGLGHSVELSAGRSELAPRSCYRLEAGEPDCRGARAYGVLGFPVPVPVEGAAPLVLPEEGATVAGLRGLEDFAYFRFRFFGRKSMPWQVRAARQVAGLLETGDREYVVMNEPPGSGKSTLFTHDVVCWIIAKRRSVRIQIGSRTERQARMYVSRIKKTLERDVPLRADEDALRLKTSWNAESVMTADYGVFRPERSDRWAADGLTVRQPGGVSADDKEQTVSAWGMDSGFLGGRFDLIIWDDLVDRRTTATAEARLKLADWYFTEAESRLEPRGLLLLQGQRIAPDDLYRAALDQVKYDGSKKYSHVVYQSHDLDRCGGVHGADARPWPEGCLLDPYRLPFHQLETIRTNSPRTYDVMYQQNDGVNVGGLVELAWLTGGKDSDGRDSPGCFDARRMLKQPPPGHGAMYSFITVDPSPTEWWGVLRWLYDPVDQVRWLMDIKRLRLRPDDWLWMDLKRHTFDGVLPRMIDDSLAEDNRVSHVIVEINAAQRWLLQQPHVREWQAVSGVTFLQHTTTRNKLDPDYGVEGLSVLFREGRIRIPQGDAAARVLTKPLVDELIRYPDGDTTDLVMACWFSMLAVDNHYRGTRRGAFQLQTAPWMRQSVRGTA